MEIPNASSAVGYVTGGSNDQAGLDLAQQAAKAMELARPADQTSAEQLEDLRRRMMLLSRSVVGRQRESFANQDHVTTGFERSKVSNARRAALVLLPK